MKNTRSIIRVILPCILTIITINTSGVQADTIFSDSFSGSHPGAWSIGHDGGGGTYAWAWPNDYAHCYADPYGSMYYYPNNLHVYMERRGVNLSGYDSANLTFSYIVDTEANWDYFTVNVRDQSGTWHEVWRKSGITDPRYWSSKTLNLDSFAGQTNLYIQFRFDSDGSVSGSPYDGVYIDNASLTATSSSITQPELVASGCYITPTTIIPGGRLTVNYRIDNPNGGNVTVGLGCSIRKNGTSTWISDPDDDVYKSCPPGESTQTRYFDVPLNAESGNYDVAWGLWETIGTGDMWDYLEKNNQFFVCLPPSTILSIDPTPPDPAVAITNRNFDIQVEVGAEISTAGVLQVMILGNNSSAMDSDWVYIPSSQSGIWPFDLEILESTSGTKEYTIYVQFRPGATTGPLVSTDLCDTLDQIDDYTIVWNECTVPDDCTDAIAFSNVPWGMSMDTSCATSDGPLLNSCVTGIPFNNVWFRFTPPTTGRYIISTCDSNYDTILRIHIGTCAFLIELTDGCNDDNGPACSGTRASLSPLLTAGTPYYIEVASYSPGGGGLTFGVELAPPPDPDLISISGIPSSIKVDNSFTVTMTAKNDSGWGGPDSSITASVLYNDGSDDVTVSGPTNVSWADSTRNFAPGDGPIYSNNCQEIPGGAIDHMVEAADNSWDLNEEHSMTFTVTPHQPGILYLRGRTTMRNGTSGCDFRNDTSISGGTLATDQQGWEAKQLTVNVWSPDQIEYGSGISPDSIGLYEQTPISITVTNTGLSTIPLLGIGVDIYDPSDKKVENTKTPYIDNETGGYGRIDFINDTPSDLGPGESRTFTAEYIFGTSVVGDDYQPGNYTFKYYAWAGGWPGELGAEPIGQLQSEPLTISRAGYPSKSIPVLMYHKVDDTSPTVFWVTVENFRKQIGLLCSLGYESITYDDLRNYALYGSPPLPDKPVIITLDDAYENTYTKAFPVLQEAGFTGVLHVPTQYVAATAGGRQQNDWDRPPEPPARHMIWPEIQELYNVGWSIQNHSVSHPDMTSLTEQEMINEIRGAQSNIFTNVGELPKYFCYPYGIFDSQVKIILQDEGYLGAIDDGGGVENTSSVNMFEMKRIYISRDDTLADFSGKIGYSGPLTPDISVEPATVIFNRELSASTSSKDMILQTGYSDANIISLDLSFDSNDIFYVESHGYTRVMLRGCVLPEGTPGTPWLPAKYINILLPLGKQIFDFDIDVDDVLIMKNIDVYPEQFPTSTTSITLSNSYTLYKEEAAYLSTNITPSEHIEITGYHKMRGYTFASIRINPIRYVPARKELYLSKEINISLYLMDETDLVSVATVGLINRKSTKFRKMLSKLVVNPEMINKIDSHINLLQPQSQEEAPTNTVEYLIITSTDLETQFQKLADHRSGTNGFSTEVITLTSIYQNTNYNGNDQQEEIKNCIIDYVNNKATEYVVLGGDDTIIPDRDCYVTVSSSTGLEIENQMPTDLYYAGLDSTWDEDGDGVYGEADTSSGDEGDLAPDVIIGRIPIRTSQQATSYINKIIDFESGLYSDLEDTLLMAGEHLGNTGNNPYTPYTGNNRPSDLINDGFSEFREHEPVSDTEMWSRRLYRDGIDPYWEPANLSYFFDTLTSWDTTSEGDFALNSINLSEKFNDGWHYVFFATHGSRTSWYLENGSYSTSSASSLNNLTGIIYTMACLTGYFDGSSDPSLSESFLRNSNGGSVAYFGCSREGWFLPDPAASNSSTGGTSMAYAYEFYEQLLNNNEEILGVIFSQHKANLASQCNSNGSYRWIQFGLNYQGDPAIGEMSNNIVIDNIGTNDLNVSHISKRSGTSWLSFASPIEPAQPPYTIYACGSKLVALTVDESQAQIGENREILEIHSDDPDEPIVEVEVILNVSPCIVDVPNVLNMTESAAESALTAVGLVKGTVTHDYSNTVPAGQVISQDPASGTSVACGSAVDLVISDGPAPIPVPDVVGMSEANAETAIIAAGLTIGSKTYACDNAVAAGNVTSQSPTAGSSVSPSSAVDLVVSTGPCIISSGYHFDVARRKFMNESVPLDDRFVEVVVMVTGEKRIQSARIQRPDQVWIPLEIEPDGNEGYYEDVCDVSTIESNWSDGEYVIEVTFTDGSVETTPFTKEPGQYPPFPNVLQPEDESDVNTATPLIVWSGEVDYMEIYDESWEEVLFAGPEEVVDKNSYIVPSGLLEESKTYILAVNYNTRPEYRGSITLVRFTTAEISKPLYGVCHGPFRQGQAPGPETNYPSVEQLEEDVSIISETASAERTYGIDRTLFQIPELCNQYGVDCYVGVYIDGNEAIDQNTISDLIDITNQGYTTTKALIVGSEFLYKAPGDPCRENYLIQLLNQVNDATDIPVTTAEPWDIWLYVHPNVANAVDFIGIHIHPFWKIIGQNYGVHIDLAAESVLDIYNEAKNTFIDKEVVILETGWPTKGDPSGSAIPSEVNQKKFLRDFVPLANENNIKYFIFEAFDEPWKKEVRNIEVEGNWGVYYEDRTLKPHSECIFYPEFVFTSIGDKEVEEGSELTFDIITCEPNIVIDINDHNLPSDPCFFYNAESWTFSWTPTYGDEGSYEVTFVAPHGEYEDFETITISVNCPSVNDVADGEVSSGTVSGSYIDTHVSDGIYESIQETIRGKNQDRSGLVHKWTIDVTGGDAVTFYIEAHHTANTEGDDFIFAYSTDNSTYTDMLTVTKTVDDNTYQSYQLPSDTNGTVYIRVVDTDRLRGNDTLDTLYIDHMYIRSGCGGGTDTWTLTVSSSSGGSVTAPGEGDFVFDCCDVVNICAEADPNCYFVNWTGSAVGAGKVADPDVYDTTVTMEGDYTLQANFASVGPENAFLQDSGSDGIVSMEAENFDDNTTQGSHIWTQISSPAGCSGGAAMRAEPDIGTNNNTGYVTNSPRLDFKVNFVKTGTHYIWIRGYKTGGEDNTCHAGLDGQVVSSCDRISIIGSSVNQWVWVSITRPTILPATFDVGAAGVQTVNIWMAKDGFRIDKILLTTSPNFTPTGSGPAESPRGT